MSNALDLDEFTDDALVREIEHRIACAGAQVCPYCGNCDKYTHVAPDHNHKPKKPCTTGQCPFASWDPKFPHVGGKRVPLGPDDQSCKMREMHRAYNDGSAFNFPLTFQVFRNANVVRANKWHNSGADKWTGSDWGNAMGGECGEAQNVIKKLRRGETGVAGAVDPARDELRLQLAYELADTVTYIDLVAAHYSINLGSAVASKFNLISEREGLPDRLPVGVRNILLEEIT